MKSISRTKSADQRYYGVAEAIVVDVNDPAKEGRVKLKFPWFDEGSISEWCRVRQLYAGNGYGTFFVPEKDDEVIVAFIHGDMRFPVVMGGLYNGQDKPSVHRDEQNDQKQIKTKAGHTITLDDSSGEEKIEIIDSSGNNHLIINAVDNTIAIQANSDISIQSQTGKLTLIATDITIDASNQMILRGTSVNIN
jgi:uncharacterized protein involved in type VI secretion and phage assembly